MSLYRFISAREIDGVLCVEAEKISKTAISLPAQLIPLAGMKVTATRNARVVICDTNLTPIPTRKFLLSDMVKQNGTLYIGDLQELKNLATETSKNSTNISKTN
jgi:hypothetical protein